jgi:hypothetical protein
MLQPAPHAAVVRPGEGHVTAATGTVRWTARTRCCTRWASIESRSGKRTRSHRSPGSRPGSLVDHAEQPHHQRCRRGLRTQPEEQRGHAGRAIGHGAGQVVLDVVPIQRQQFGVARAGGTSSRRNGPIEFAAIGAPAGAGRPAEPLRLVPQLAADRPARPSAAATSTRLRSSDSTAERNSPSCSAISGVASGPSSGWTQRGLPGQHPQQLLELPRDRVSGRGAGLKERRQVLGAAAGQNARKDLGRPPGPARRRLLAQRHELEPRVAIRLASR